MAAAGSSGQRWLWLPLVACNGLTGAAVLRAAGRIFLGWGPAGGREEQSPTDDEREKPDRPLWLMLLPTLVMLAGACLDAGAASLASSAASMAMGMPPSAIPPQPGAPATLLAWLSVGLALAMAAYALFEHHLPDASTSGIRRVVSLAGAGLDYLHSGAIGDYVAWLMVGLALFTAAFLAGLSLGAPGPGAGSAAANHAVGTAIRARDQHLQAPVNGRLVYPVIRDALTAPSCEEAKAGPPHRLPAGSAPASLGDDRCPCTTPRPYPTR